MNTRSLSSRPTAGSGRKAQSARAALGKRPLNVSAILERPAPPAKAPAQAQALEQSYTASPWLGNRAVSPEERIRQQLAWHSKTGSYADKDSFMTWSSSCDENDELDGLCGPDALHLQAGPEAMSAPRPPANVYQGSCWAKGSKGEKLQRPYQDRYVAFNQYAVLPTSGHAGQMPEPLRALQAAGTPLCITAVFDGHGHGEHATDRAAQLTLPSLSNNHHIFQTLSSSAVVNGELQDTELAQITAGMSQIFHAMDADILAESHAQGHLNGATALLAVLCGCKLYSANAGDSRAVLSRGGQALRVSRDHTPALSQERARIIANGGTVIGQAQHQRVVLYKGTQRKSCALSRALGDRDFKDAGLMIADPDVCATVLRPGRDNFFIAASDGLWVCVDDQTAVDCVSRVLAAANGLGMSGKALAGLASRQLLDLATSLGSTDDITVVVNLFDWEQ